MESLDEQATRFGIERPELKHYEYMDGNVVVVALTPESDYAWAEYLRAIGQARLALIQ